MSFASATFEEVLDDLSCRFIINIPEEESLSVQRLGFQVEEAHWYYEDFVREQNPSLPTFQLKQFSAILYKHCPLLQKWTGGHDKHYSEFVSYKLSVPVCGAIILNPELDKCVCVKGYNNRSSWGFPRGKIDIDEEDHSCAAREIMEEIGFDLNPYIVKENYIQIVVRKQRIRLFIVPCIPETLAFRPTSRKEISRIQWFPLGWFPRFSGVGTKEDLGYQADIKIEGHGRFYMINPFMDQLSKWIKKYKKSPSYALDLARAPSITLNPDPPTKPNQPTTEQLHKEHADKLDSLNGKFTPSDWKDFKFDTNLILAHIDSAFIGFDG